MKHILVVYGKRKGRKNLPLYVGPVPEAAALNALRWLVVQFLDLGPTPEHIK